MAQKARIEWEIALKDLATKTLKDLGTNVKKETKKADGAFKKMGKSVGRAVVKMAKLATAALGVGSALMLMNTAMAKIQSGVKDAIEFSKAMAEVSTISEAAGDSLGYVSRQVLDLSTSFGVMETVAAKALYQVISAGQTDLRNAFGVLEGAVVLSKAGLADLVSTVDLLTNTINAYGKSVDEVEHINNVFFETVRLGKTTIPEMAESMGVATPISAALGVSLEELTAMLATLTKGGVNTTTSVIYLRQAMVSILKPSQDALDLMHAHGIQFDYNTIRSKGFMGILVELKKKLGDNIDAWQKFFPNVRAFIPVLSLAGAQFQEFQSILRSLTSDTLDESAPAFQALQRVMMSAGEKIQVMGNAARQGLMMLGMGVIEGLTGPIQTMGQLEAASFAIRDAIGGLTPLVNTFVGVMMYMLSVLPEVVKVFSEIATTFFGLEKSTVAKLDQMSASMGELGEAARAMGNSLLTGDITATKALQGLVEAQKARRKAMLTAGIDARATLDRQEALNEALGDQRSALMELSRAHRRAASEALTGAARDAGMDEARKKIEAVREKIEELGLSSKLTAEQVKGAFTTGIGQKGLDGIRDWGQMLDEAIKSGAKSFDEAVTAIQGYEETLSSGAVTKPYALITGAQILAEAALNIEDSGDKASTALANFAQQFGREVGPLADEMMRALDPEGFEAALLNFLSVPLTDATGIQQFLAPLLSGGVLPEVTGRAIGDAFQEYADSANAIPDGVSQMLASGVGAGFGTFLGPSSRVLIEESVGTLSGMVGRAAGEAKATKWAAGIYKMLSTGLDSAFVSLLSPEAKRQLEINVAAVQKTLEEVVGKGLGDVLSEEAGLGSMSGVALTPEEREAQELRVLFAAEQESILEMVAHQQEVLAFSTSKSAASQIESIELVMKKERALLNLRKLSTEAGVHLSEAQHAELMAALEAGAAERIALIDKTEKERLRRIEKMAPLVAEALKSPVALGMKLGVDAAVAELKRLKGAVRHLFGEELADELGGALGGLMAHVQVTPELNLERLQGEIEAARAQTQKDFSADLISEEQMQSLEALIKNVEDYTLKELKAAAANAAFARSLEDLTPVQKGVAKGLKSFTDQIPEFGDAMAEVTEVAMANFANGLTDAMMAWGKGAETAGEAWKRFAASFVQDVTRMITQMLILQAIKIAFGVTPVADGGVVEGGTGPLIPLATGGVVIGGLGRALPVHGYATGGPIVKGPHIAMIGEGRDNEAIVPLPDGRSIPVDMRGGGGADISFTINAVDARGIDELLVERQDTIRNLIRQAMTEDRVFRSTFTQRA
tara:strand:- start:23898 stop:27806 length:3909 start_codon:yes stop_codon:yes gene_type:complete